MTGFLYYYNAIKIPNAIATKKLAIKFPDKYEEYKAIKCDLFDFINPEYTFIAKRPERDYELFFFNIKTSNIFSKEIILDYIGGSDIKNTTFSQLLKLVKQDCSQFQKSKGNYTDKTINWSYSKYIPEPVLTPEEQKEKDRKDLVDELKMELEWYDEEELQYVKETYGITKRSMDSEFLEWNKRALENGYFVE